ncbi:MAG: tRNA pseudouridine(38-40) synthase TruA [Gemmatimonadota bacterium]
MSRTFLALLHYDGGSFVGWQRQTTGRSVQGEFESVLERLAGGRTVAHAAGRTDAGVHARGMGVSFSLAARWTGEKAQRALNALLPRDCWVERVQEMRTGFHARKTARSRRYEYLIGTDESSGSPFRRPYEWALGRELDASAMALAAGRIKGSHDFRPFAAKGQVKPHYRCAIGVAEWSRRSEVPGVRLEIEADRFLHHMVRMLVGTMVDIGLDRRPVTDMEALLARTDNNETSPPAPPQGLYFLAADYSAEWYADGIEDTHAS